MAPILGESYFFSNMERHFNKNDVVGVIFEGPSGSGKTIFKDFNNGCKIGKNYNVSFEISDDLPAFKELYSKWTNDGEKRLVILKTHTREETLKMLSENGVKKRIFDIILFKVDSV